MPRMFRVEQKGGAQQLLESIGGHLREPGLRALGIVADANTGPDARWQGISDRWVWRSAPETWT